MTLTDQIKLIAIDEALLEYKKQYPLLVTRIITMRVDPSNARAQVQAATAKVAERKPKPERQLPTEQAARPEAKPKQQATKNNRIDVRA